MRGLLIVRLLLSHTDRAAASHSVFHSGLEDCLDFVAGVLGVPLVHDIQERREVIILWVALSTLLLMAMNRTPFFGKKNLCVVANLQIISAKTTEILYHKGLHSSGFDFFQQGGKTGTIKVQPE